MVNAWEWQEWCLLVTIRNRASASIVYLLRKVSQEDFLEHYLASYAKDGYGMILEMTVTGLTQESYELLEPYYKDNQKMEG